MLYVAANGKTKTTALFSEWANGRPVAIRNSGTGQWVSGLIVKIEMESGYNTGDTPTHFLVTLFDPESGSLEENLYVHAAV